MSESKQIRGLRAPPTDAPGLVDVLPGVACYVYSANPDTVVAAVKLIAAAPELLEACKAILACAATDTPAQCEAVRRMRAAIAAAEGGVPCE